MAERIDPKKAYQDMHSEEEALLVCAYNDGEKFMKNHLEGAISLDEFQSQSNDIAADREVIFYCA